MGKSCLILGALVVAAPLAARQTSEDLVRERLTAGVAERIISLMESATERALPAQAVADVALYGAARGATPDAIVAAAGTTLRWLDLSRDVLESDGRVVTDDEIAAGAQALRAGVDPDRLRALSQDARNGQSLAANATLLAGLAVAGVPAGQAAAVLSNLNIAAWSGPGTTIGGFTLPFGPPNGLPVNLGAPGERPGRPLGPSGGLPGRRP